MKIKANGISINYEIEGKGPDFVLIHGAGDNLNMWFNQVPVLSKNYRVIRFDVRGSGKTDRPQVDYSTSLFAEDAWEFLKTIGVKEAIFMGYSMGGRIAMELALKHPGLVKALVLANSSVGVAPPSTGSTDWRKNVIEMLDKGDMKSASELMATRAFSPGFKEKHPAEFEKYRKIKAESKPDGIARLMRGISFPAAQLDLTKVNFPVLITGGEYDLFMTPELCVKTQKVLAGSKMVVFPTGHAAVIEMPDKFNKALLEFLSGLKN
jgi:3-oxoadipate enol-lactonase